MQNFDKIEKPTKPYRKSENLQPPLIRKHKEKSNIVRVERWIRNIRDNIHDLNDCWTCIEAWLPPGDYLVWPIECGIKEDYVQNEAEDED